MVLVEIRATTCVDVRGLEELSPVRAAP